MKQTNLTLVNATLPLLGESLYQLTIKQGNWNSITPQEDYIDPSTIAGDTAVIDVGQKVIISGMVDGHMHLDKAFSLARVGNISGTLDEACINYTNYITQFTKEELKQRMIKAALYAIAFGTSYIRTHIDFHANLGKEITDRAVEAAIEARELLKNYITIQYILLIPDVRKSNHRELVIDALSRGMDGIGGAPILMEDARGYTDAMFELAREMNCILDLHSDESDDPSAQSVTYIAHKTIEYGMQGKITVGHLCSLASMDDDLAAEVISQIASAKLHVMTLPGANLYLQGREDTSKVRRGVTRVKELLAAGVNVCVASDNIHDPFHPFGRGDVLLMGLLTGYGSHLGSPADMRTILQMLTNHPARAIGLEQYGIIEGLPASFVMFDATSVEQLFTMLPERRWIYRNEGWIRQGEPLMQWDDAHLAELWRSVQ